MKRQSYVSISFKVAFQVRMANNTSSLKERELQLTPELNQWPAGHIRMWCIIRKMQNTWFIAYVSIRPLPFSIESIRDNLPKHKPFDLIRILKTFINNPLHVFLMTLNRWIKNNIKIVFLMRRTKFPFHFYLNEYTSSDS